MYFLDRHKTITCYYESLTRAACDKYQLTQMEYDILMFLYGNPQINTAADIVRICKYTKSHVSTSLKHLEDRELVRKVQSETNKKQIAIFTTDSAQEIIQNGLDTKKLFAKTVLEGVTAEELEAFRKVFDKVCQNAEAHLHKKTKKEL